MNLYRHIKNSTRRKSVPVPGFCRRVIIDLVIKKEKSVITKVLHNEVEFETICKPI